MKTPFPIRLFCVALCLFAWPASAQLSVVTTTTDLGDFVRAVGGSRVKVETICHGAQDPHYVQSRPSYMVLLSRADLVVAVGLDLEVGWLPALIQGARNPAIRKGQRGYLDASSAISAIDVHTGAVDRSLGDIHQLGNPHYWLDPNNAKRVARAIADRLSALDPSGAALFAQNAQAFSANVDKALSRWAALMAPYRGTKVVSYHRTFDYFFAHFGLVAIGYLEHRPGIPPSPAHVAGVIRDMRAQKVRVIFHENFFDRAVSDLAASKSGAHVLLLPVSVNGVAGVKNYQQLVDYIVKAFVGALAKSGGGAQAP